MTFTKPRELVIAGLLAAVVTYLGLRVLYSSLPPLPRFAGITLVILAVIEVALGFSLRGRIQGGEGKAVQPLTAARAVALAKASSLLGAIMLGVWLAGLAYLLPRRDELAAAAGDVPSAEVGVICAAVLIGGALWLEHCCRTPDDPDERPVDDVDSAH